MWPRFSLRLQIILVLALALGGEALLGATWLFVVLERTFEAHRAAEVFQFYLSYMAIDVLALLVLGSYLFNRTIARPVDRLAGIADRIGQLELPNIAEDGAPMLGQLGAAFERMARALQREQARTGQQIAQLTQINRALQEARDSLVRQEKLATVGRLAAGVAHEVGNPLGGILGYAQLLKVKGGEVGREYGERIEREVARIDQTVRGLLDFSRPRDLALVPTSLPPAIQGALALCHADQRFRAVEARVELPEGLPPVMADEHRLSQVLVNLLLNAGDAMQGRGLVIVRARAEDIPPRSASAPASGRLVCLEIADSGPGIPAEILPRIFDPFFSTKEVGQGTGLGLSICASIMDAFGGDIRAESRPEGGARFALTFRVAG